MNEFPPKQSSSLGGFSDNGDCLLLKPGWAPAVIQHQQHRTLAYATSITGALSLPTVLDAVWHSGFKHRLWSQAKLVTILFRKFWDWRTLYEADTIWWWATPGSQVSWGHRSRSRKSLKSPSELLTLSSKGCSQEIRGYITETKDEV